MGRYILETENVAGGGSTNPAQTVIHTIASVATAQAVAQLVAFAQYMLPAEDTLVSRVLFGADAPGPTLPQPFPAVEYGLLAAADSNLAAMTDFGVTYGFNPLTALGVGAVMSKRTATPGRHGLGRLTTPWLPTSWVDAGGQLATGGPAVVEDGWRLYLMGDLTTVPTSPAVDLQPKIYDGTGASHPIVTVTVSSRLGRLRSRTI